jgi:hypothetical protein
MVIFKTLEMEFLPRAMAKLDLHKTKAPDFNRGLRDVAARAKNESALTGAHSLPSHKVAHNLAARLANASARLTPHVFALLIV